MLQKRITLSIGMGGTGFENTTWEKELYAYAEAHKDQVQFEWGAEKSADLRAKIKADMAAGSGLEVPFERWWKTICSWRYTTTSP